MKKNCKLTKKIWINGFLKGKLNKAFLAEGTAKLWKIIKYTKNLGKKLRFKTTTVKQFKNVFSIRVFSFKKKFHSHSRAFELGHIPFKIYFSCYLHLWQNMKLRLVICRNRHSLIFSEQNPLLRLWATVTGLFIVSNFQPTPQWKKFGSKSGKIQTLIS